jgi:hypothetical protein
LPEKSICIFFLLICSYSQLGSFSVFFCADPFLLTLGVVSGFEKNKIKSFSFTVNLGIGTGFLLMLMENIVQKEFLFQDGLHVTDGEQTLY